MSLSAALRARPVALTVAAYGGVAGLSFLISGARGQSPLVTEPWVDAPSWVRLLASLLLGGALAAVTVAVTPTVTRRSARLRALHEDLRPVVTGQSDGTLAVMALASGVGEELLFRGALTPLLGVVLSSAGFGLLHQVRGTGRWLWVAWAAAMGAVFAVVFLATGHLVGAVVGHVVVNALNLRFLRDHDPGPSATSVRARLLGGLLRS